ncbi:MAG: MBL fold metallo-hydrolase [Polyangiaceae bacterium]|nr:MBL fold metallo-hydrolase [Polyangiaceae bacterium]MCB9605709.1 MBL fold metallo-hydrolase [Polyangiaceae bacterium]
MFLRQLFDLDSSTYTYLVADPETKQAALIDPVKGQADRDLQLIAELGFELRYVLDTHVHADHITAAGELRERTGAESVAGKAGAGCVSVHVSHGDALPLGNLSIRALATPGHTDDSMSYHVGNAVFTGDALLIRGCGRTDFQNGDAGTLFDSITGVLFELPADTQVFPGHDYRGHATSTIAEERSHNPRVAGRTREQFIELMNNLQLAKPRRIDEAIRANRVCGNTSAPFASLPKAPTGYFQLQADEFVQAVPDARLIDVREPAEFEGDLGHVQNAELVPLSTVARAAKDWSRDQPLLMICRSGRRSAMAAEQLLGMGFEQVANLEGGMLAYHHVLENAPTLR